MDTIENPFTAIENRLNRIENLLKKLDEKELPPTDDFCDIETAAAKLNLTRSTLYKLVFERRIPYYKNGKRLFFKPSELKDYIEQTRKAVI